jgi:hypothetical protein
MDFPGYSNIQIKLSSLDIDLCSSDFKMNTKHLGILGKYRNQFNCSVLMPEVL